VQNQVPEFVRDVESLAFCRLGCVQEDVWGAVPDEAESVDVVVFVVQCGEAHTLGLQ
jgi:hypothetical protein